MPQKTEEEMKQASVTGDAPVCHQSPDNIPGITRTVDNCTVATSSIVSTVSTVSTKSSTSTVNTDNLLKSVTICAIRHCENTRNKNRDKSYFSMPAEHDRLLKWIEAADRSDMLELLKTMDANYFHLRFHVCSDHFVSSSYKNKDNYSQGLEFNAVPTVNLVKNMVYLEHDYAKAPERINQLMIDTAIWESLLNNNARTCNSISMIPKGVVPTLNFSKCTLNFEQEYMSKRNSMEKSKSNNTNGKSSDSCQKTDSDVLITTKKCQILADGTTRKMGPSASLSHEEEKIKELKQSLQHYKKEFRKKSIQISKLKMCIKKLKSRLKITIPDNNNKMNSVCDHFIRTQLKLSQSRKPQKRFDSLDKEFALALYTCSQESYAFLQEFFHLPNPKLLKMPLKRQPAM